MKPIHKIAWLVAISMAVLGLGETADMKSMAVDTAHADTQTVVVDAGSEMPPPKKTLFDGKDEASWGYVGRAPRRLFFNDTWVERKIANQINEAIYSEETNPTYKARYYRGSALNAGIDGLVFKKVKGRPGEVQVITVGPTRTVAIKQTISLRDLEAGKPIECTFPRAGRDFAGIGTAQGGGTIKFHYDRDKEELVMDKMVADFTFSFGFTYKDSATFGEAKLERHTFDYRPELEKKFILDLFNLE